MARDYSDYPERESRHIVKNERNDYQDKFFHDIDLDFLLDAIMNIELEGYTLNIVNNKLQLLDNDGDVVSEVDISQGSQGPVGPTPNISMNASVDSNIGTPSVEIVKTGTAEQPVFSLAFHNLKGQKGDTGQPGQSIVGPAGQDGVTPVVSATASVDSNTGTPGVTVTKTGTTENPVFNFAFTNIKGATGAASTVPGPAGEPGTPFQVKAQYDTWAEFIAAHPTGEVGDAYQVGSNDEYYTKDEVDNIVDDINQVPSGGNNGDVLTKATTGPMWAPPVKELPAIASGDAGKVLSVNSGETGVEWVTPQGGGSEVIPVFWSNTWMNLEEIWDSAGQTKLFTRGVDTSFQFVAGTTYRLKAVKKTIPAKVKFYQSGSNVYGAAVPKAETINLGTATGESSLSDMDMTQVTLIPYELSVSRLWPMSQHMSGTLDDLSGLIEVHKQPTQPLDTLLDDSIYFRARVSYTPSETWTWDVSTDWGGNLGFATKSTYSYFNEYVEVDS